jgi:hypothetical protein
VGEHHARDTVVKTVRVSLVAVGSAMMLFGVVSAVTNHGFKAFRQIAFLVLALVLHDGFLLPAFLVIGLLVHRFVPRRGRAIAQAGLIATAAATFVALPFVLGYGRIPDNPSALPRNYVAGYWLLIGVIWLAVALTLAARIARRRGSGAPTLPDHEPEQP